MLKYIVLVLTLVVIVNVAGHGSMHDPVNRQSRWRYDDTAPKNYDDTGVHCGSYFAQWNDVNKGRCGFCGDDFSDPQPRTYELGGKHGQGVIVKTYKQGGELPVKVQLTANHKGYFYFQLCNLDRNGNRESDECFDQIRLKLTNGADTYPLPHYESGWFDLTLRIPDGLTCEHCVLQWTYYCGNRYGECADGTKATGCGQQEHFRGCSDIRITN